MVHRNTEYKLKYYFPNEELSKKIWLENIKFRESQRTMNLADHYWNFQTSSEACDCEECSISKTKCGGKVTLKGDEKDNKKSISPDISKIDMNANNAGTRSSREAGVQTPKWISTQTSEAVNIGNLPLKKKSSLSQDTIRGSDECWRKGHPPLSKKQHSTKSPPTAEISQYSLSKMSKRLQDMDEAHNLFFPFGLNNDNKNIGDMKTFNVLAAQKEVQSSAIMAMKRRKAQLEQVILSKEDKKRQKSASLLSIPRINHSSIWITEYRDKFSKAPMTSR